MRLRTRRAALLVSLLAAAPLSAQDGADDRVAALGEEYRLDGLAAYGLTETESGATEPGARLWSVTPEVQRARAARYAEILERLNAIDTAMLSDQARTDALVLRTLLQQQIGDARFSE